MGLTVQRIDLSSFSQSFAATLNSVDVNEVKYKIKVGRDLPVKIFMRKFNAERAEVYASEAEKTQFLRSVV